MPRWKVSLHNKHKKESEKDWDLYFVSFYFFLLDTCYVKSKKEVLPAVCLLLSPLLLNCSSLQEIRPLLAKPGHTSHWWRRRRLTMTLSSTSSHYSKPGHSLPNLAIPHTGGEGGGWKWHCYQHLATPGNSLPNQAIPHTGEGEGWRQPQHQLIAEKIQPHPPMFMRPPKSTSGHTLTNMVIPHSQYHAEKNDVRIISIVFIVIPVAIFPPPLVCASNRLLAITSQSFILYFEVKN